MTLGETDRQRFRERDKQREDIVARSVGWGWGGGVRRREEGIGKRGNFFLHPPTTPILTQQTDSRESARWVGVLLTLRASLSGTFLREGRMSQTSAALEFGCTALLTDRPPTQAASRQKPPPDRKFTSCCCNRTIRSAVQTLLTR